MQQAPMLIPQVGKENLILDQNGISEQVMIQDQILILAIGNVVGIKAEKPPSKSTKKKDPDAPKRSRARPKKEGQPKPPKANGAASPSGSSSDEEEEEPPEPHPAAPPGPEGDPERDAIIATTNAVWLPRNRPATAEKIRSSIAAYGELLKSLREKWEGATEALKKADLNNQPSDELRRQVTQWRKIVQIAMDTTIRDGHPSNVKKYVENHLPVKDHPPFPLPFSAISPQVVYMLVGSAPCLGREGCNVCMSRSRFSVICNQESDGCIGIVVTQWATR